jgi:hypothetical protein
MAELSGGERLSAEATPLPMVEAEAPLACSLGAGDLVERLDRIARIGTRSWLGEEFDGQRQLLRFRDDRRTRTELEAVIAAERECCSFLDLALDVEQGEIVLTIDAGPEGEPVAAALARAFAPQSASDGRAPAPTGP